MEWLFLTLGALFGFCLGSFWNVCIYRLPRQGVKITWPPFSFCPHCYFTLRWYENIPLLSYLLQGGKCRRCYVWISPRYPMVELLGGIILAWLSLRFLTPPKVNLVSFVVYLGFFSALVVASLIDLELRIIPDEISKPGMVLAPLFCFLFPELLPKAYWVKLPFSLSLHLQAFLSSLAGVASGAFLIYGIGAMGKWIFQREAMGFGDVKFMGFLGGFLGPFGVVIAFLVACFLGAAIGIVRKLTSKDPYIPFGPFLALGSVAALFFRKELFFLLQQYLLFLRHLHF